MSEKNQKKHNENYQKKAKEAKAWLSSAEGEEKLRRNLKSAQNFTDLLVEKRQFNVNKLKEVVTI